MAALDDYIAETLANAPPPAPAALAPPAAEPRPGVTLPIPPAETGNAGPSAPNPLDAYVTETLATVPAKTAAAVATAGPVDNPRAIGQGFFRGIGNTISAGAAGMEGSDPGFAMGDALRQDYNERHPDQPPLPAMPLDLQLGSKLPDWVLGRHDYQYSKDALGRASRIAGGAAEAVGGALPVLPLAMMSGGGTAGIAPFLASTAVGGAFGNAARQGGELYDLSPGALDALDAGTQLATAPFAYGGAARALAPTGEIGPAAQYLRSVGAPLTPDAIADAPGLGSMLARKYTPSAGTIGDIKDALSADIRATPDRVAVSPGNAADAGFVHDLSDTIDNLGEKAGQFDMGTFAHNFANPKKSRVLSSLLDELPDEHGERIDQAVQTWNDTAAKTAAAQAAAAKAGTDSPMAKFQDWLQKEIMFSGGGALIGSLAGEPATGALLGLGMRTGSTAANAALRRAMTSQPVLNFLSRPVPAGMKASAYIANGARMFPDNSADLYALAHMAKQNED